MSSPAGPWLFTMAVVDLKHRSLVRLVIVHFSERSSHGNDPEMHFSIRRGDGYIVTYGMIQ